jgi:signal transduction histidine kinase
MSSADETPASTRRRWPTPSLRLRITLLTLLVFLTIQAVLSVGLYAYVRQQHTNDLEQKLAERTASLAEKLSSTSALTSNEAFAALVEDEPRSILIEDLLTSLYTSKGKLLASNCRPEVSFAMAGAADAIVGQPPVHRTFDVRALQTAEGRPRPGRTVAVRLADPTGRDLVLITATSEGFLDQLSNELRRNILWAIPVGVAAAFCSGWLFSGMAVTPRRRLQQIAQLLSPSSLGARIDFGSTATEVSKLQERLNEARRRLDAGYRAQEQFAGNVAHELKTPLAIIVAQADVVRAGAGPMPAMARQFIDVTRDEALRLARLCESFLLLTRVRHGKPVTIGSKPVGVNEWMMDCIEESQAAATRFGVEIKPTLLFEEDVIDASVAGDRELLITMLDNLIRNACRFSPAGARVEVSASIVDGKRVRVGVRDHGPGVPPMMLEKIFERFVQAEQSEPSGRKGSGIGLAIAQGIAELHGGGIGVENKADGGCEFHVELPLVEEGEPVVDTSPVPSLVRSSNTLGEG